MKKTTLFFQYSFVLLVLISLTKGYAQCAPTPGVSTIGGKAFTDTNQDGIQQGGEADEPGIAVDLYYDINANGILETGEPLLQSTATNATGDYVFSQGSVVLTETVSDEFDFVGFNNNDGTEDWNNIWQEYGDETDGPSAGYIQVTNETGITTNALRYGGIYDPVGNYDIKDTGVYRVANLTGALNATLSFDFYKDLSGTSDYKLKVEVSTDGSNWDELDKIDKDYSEGLYTYNLNSYISASTYIRFDGDGSFKKETYDYFAFDNITITFDRPSVPLDYIVQLDVPALGPGYTITTPIQYGANFSATGEASCDNDFGLYFCGATCTPRANDDFGTVLQLNSIMIDVLSNDTDGNDNIDVNSLTIITQPIYGSLSINPGTGEVTYTPNGNFFGTDSYEYEICDDTALCDTATVTIVVEQNLIDACLQASEDHIYYIPYSDTELRTALDNSSGGPGSCTLDVTDDVRRVTSIKTPYPGTVIIYDHWEDGYEANIKDPVQATTQVWGDNDNLNGTALGYPDDYIPSGGNFVLDNTYNYNPRNPLDFYFDGKDKIYTTADVAISTVAGDVARFTLQTTKTDVYDTQKFGTAFTVPFGEELLDDFEYTSLFIRASLNNTTVNVDLDNDGTVDNTSILNEGEVFFIDGGVQSGASITSTLPVGVDLFFGGLNCFGTRQINLLPRVFLSDVYYSPVPTTDPGSPSVVYFYNDQSFDIDIDWESDSNTGSVNVPAKSTASLSLSDNTGYRFQSRGGVSYVASQVVDNDSSAYDWAFNLISEERLTDLAAIAWAPGSLDGTRNDNPVWVTPNADTTVYIKFDGDLTSTTALTSPCGIPYDISVAVNYLNYHKIFDTVNNDNDQGGLALYTCDGTKIFAVYGEDPSLALAASPSLDVGTTMQPLCSNPQIFSVDDRAYTISDTSLQIPVLFNDSSFITNIDTGSVSTILPPENGVLIVNTDGTINYEPNAGYTGTDTFEYSVCSLEYPGVCDVATVIVTIDPCPTPANKNMVFGNLFVDLNEDTINNDGQGVNNVKVDIYEDLNLNGIIDGGDLPLPTTPSTTSDVNGNYQFLVPTYNVLIEDDFSSSNYTGGSNWNGDWTEVGEADGSATGDISIDTERLKVRNNKSATRQVDLSPAIFGSISFDVSEDGDIDITDEVEVKICSDNTDFNCQTLFLTTDDFTSGSISNAFIELDKLTDTAVLKVVTTGYTAVDEIFYIDNIVILTAVRGKNLLIETDLSTLPAGYSLSTDNVESADFAPTGTVGLCDQTNDFGFLVCKMTDPGLAISCNDNGTPMDGTDDTFTFSVDPVGVRFGSTYTVSGDVGGTGTYGTPLSFGPFPNDGSTRTITITDDTGNCVLEDVDIDVSVSRCLSASSPTSIDFDGVDDYMSTTKFLDGTQELTMMAWVMLDPSDPGGSQKVIAGEDVYCRLAIEGDNSPSFTVRTDITPTISINANPIPKGEWHHVTGTFSSTTGESKIYVDGELLNTSSTDFTGATITATGLETDHFEVGRWSRESAPDKLHFFGSIDEVRVFNTALTESQIQRIVYQEIEQNGGNVRGTIIKKDVTDNVTSNPILWNDLELYYNMENVASGKTFDTSGKLRDANLNNINFIQSQTAPMPYETVADGPWTAQATWLHGDVWDIEDLANNKDWSIVNIKNDVTSVASHTNLGLIIDSGSSLSVSGENSIHNNWYLQLDGALDLADDSQLIQSDKSDLVTGANGKIIRRQEGNRSLFWYNYWSPPVGNPVATTLGYDNGSGNNPNNTPFTLNNLKDSSGTPMSFTWDYSPTSGEISKEWLYTFTNGVTYYDWERIDENTNINPGTGYTQKGTVIGSGEQQYIFEGRPNNGTILLGGIDVGGPGSVEDVSLTSYFVGNPYPSALDARQFIADNAGTIGGTILLWEQWAGSSHFLADYEGGYGFINNTTTERAYQYPGIPIADQVQTEGIKRPTYYIPVAQGFFVEVASDGDIEFNNGQRIFIKESDAMADQNHSDYADYGSSFMRTANTESQTSAEEETEQPQILRLEFGVSSGASRSFVIGFTADATDGKDYGLDGGLVSNPPEDDMGSLLDGEQYVIQTFAPYTNNKVIDLVFNASGNFTYAIKATEITNFPDDQDIYLVDNLTGLAFSLRDSESYSFTSEAGTFTERFDIVFQEPSTLSNEEFIAENILIYVNQPEDKLYVKQLSDQAKGVTLINMLGQIVRSFDNINNQILENGISVADLNSGVYIVSILQENDLKIDRKIVLE